MILSFFNIGFSEKNYKYLDSAGPTDFLSLIKNAQFVVTNSFHGLAFCIIFKKKFIICPHSTRNERLVSLMESCGISFSDKNIEIDDDIYYNLSSDIEKSKNYILDSIKMTEN